MITETRTRHAEPDITVLEIAGRLSLGNTLVSIENTIKRLVDEGSRRLVVELSGLNSIDSSGIGMLLTCFAYMEHKGGHLRLAGAHDTVLNVFETVHMDRIVPMFADLDTASRDFPA